MPATKTKPKPKTGRRRRYDWQKAKALYVEGVDEDGEIIYPSLRMVARLLDYEPARVRERSAADGWVEARASHRAELARTRRDVRLRQIAETAVDLDLRALASARAGVDLVSRRIADALRAETGPGQDPAAGRIDAKELAALGVALRRFHTVGLAALGERPLRHPDDETAEGYLEASLDAGHARLLEGFRSFRERFEAGDVAGAIEAASSEAEP